MILESRMLFFVPYIWIVSAEVSLPVGHRFLDPEFFHPSVFYPKSHFLGQQGFYGRHDMQPISKQLLGYQMGKEYFGNFREVIRYDNPVIYKNVPHQVPVYTPSRVPVEVFHSTPLPAFPHLTSAEYEVVHYVPRQEVFTRRLYTESRLSTEKKKNCRKEQREKIPDNTEKLTIWNKLTTVNEKIQDRRKIQDPPKGTIWIIEIDGTIWII